MVEVEVGAEAEAEAVVFVEAVEAAVRESLLVEVLTLRLLLS